MVKVFAYRMPAADHYDKIIDNEMFTHNPAIAVQVEIPRLHGIETD